MINLNGLAFCGWIPDELILYDFVKPSLLESKTDIDHRETNFLTQTRGDHYLNAKSKQTLKVNKLLGDQMRHKYKF